MRTMIFVWAALLAFLAATIGASFVLTGPPSLAANMGIALAKALLIYWFYMHLREETGVIRLVAGGAAAWLLILLLLTSADYATR